MNQTAKMVTPAYALRLEAKTRAIPFEYNARLGIRRIETSKKVLSRGVNKG